MDHPEGAGSKRADRGACRASRPRHHLPAGRGCGHRPDGARYPCRNPPSSSATVMRVTEIQAEPDQKRQDRSARHAEIRGPWARTPRLRGPIRPVPAAGATADAVRGKKCLFSKQLQAILTSNGGPPWECRLRRLNDLQAQRG